MSNYKYLGSYQPFWSDLQKAVFEDYPIQSVYENFNGEVAERLLEPYSLVAKAAQWYLVAKRDGLSGCIA